MALAVCPYCRAPIDPSVDQELTCPGCGTPHHADCFAENTGCTVFGCSSAPAQEQKLSLSGEDLSLVSSSANSQASVAVVPQVVPHGAATVASPASPTRVPPPPPLPGLASTPIALDSPLLPRPVAGVGSVLFAAQPIPVAAPTQSLDFDLTPDPNAKNRTTFIVLGVLLGAFGIHNFYAGYRNKAFAQLLITIFTVGFAGPMIWVWAVIDVCTIDRDSEGVKFRS